MITEPAFGQLLQLNECWELLTAEFETEPAPGRFTILVRETAALWPRQRCPEATCGGERSCATTMLKHGPGGIWTRSSRDWTTVVPPVSYASAGGKSGAPPPRTGWCSCALSEAANPSPRPASPGGLVNARKAAKMAPWPRPLTPDPTAGHRARARSRRHSGEPHGETWPSPAATWQATTQGPAPECGRKTEQIGASSYIQVTPHFREKDSGKYHRSVPSTWNGSGRPEPTHVSRSRPAARAIRAGKLTKTAAWAAGLVNGGLQSKVPETFSGRGHELGLGVVAFQPYFTGRRPVFEIGARFDRISGTRQAQYSGLEGAFL